MPEGMGTEQSAPVSESAPAQMLTPSNAASYDRARKSLMEDWAGESDAEEGAPEEVEGAEAEVTEGAEPEGEASPTLPEAEEAEVAEGEEAAEGTEPPTPEEAAGQPDAEAPAAPQEPRPYTAQVGEEEVEIPEGLTFTYQADGQQVTRSANDVIRAAQMGENFGRRSRELAQQQRDLERYHQQQDAGLRQQYDALYQETILTARRLAEDEEFRDQFLEEYERLRENPEEIRLRLEAQRAQELEGQLNAIQGAQREQFNRAVWSLVDQLLAAGVGTDEAPGPYRYANVDEVRKRFQEEIARRGNVALSDGVVRQIMAEEHQAVAQIVERELGKVRQDGAVQVQRQVQQARAEAAVETRNKITEKALRREKEARQTLVRSPAPVQAPKPAKIEKFADGRKALDRWAAS